jgi:predicted RNA-binding Zn ribbon-like protein
MDFSHYNDHPVDLAVDLVNTLDAADGSEGLLTPSDVARFIDTHENQDWCSPGWQPTDRDLHEVRALRSRLREVWLSNDEEEAAAVLNAILNDVHAVPRLSVHGEGPHLHFESRDASPARWLGAITAMGLTVAMIEGGFDRFGVCASGTCEDVFVDTSRNHSRLHCSGKCTTRENVAAHRARQREQV